MSNDGAPVGKAAVPMLQLGALAGRDGQASNVTSDASAAKVDPAGTGSEPLVSPTAAIPSNVHLLSRTNSGRIKINLRFGMGLDFSVSEAETDTELGQPAQPAGDSSTQSTAVGRERTPSRSAVLLEPSKIDLLLSSIGDPSNIADWSRGDLHQEVIRQQGVLIDLLHHPISIQSVGMLMQLLTNFMKSFKTAKKRLQKNEHSALFVRQTSRWIKSAQLTVRLKQSAAEAFPLIRDKIETTKMFLESAIRARNTGDAQQYESRMSSQLVAAGPQLRLTQEGHAFWESTTQYLQQAAKSVEAIRSSVNNKLLHALSLILEAEQALELGQRAAAIVAHDKARTEITSLIASEPGAQLSGYCVEVTTRYKQLDATLAAQVTIDETAKALQDEFAKSAELYEDDTSIGPVDRIKLRCLQNTARLRIV